MFAVFHNDDICVTRFDSLAEAMEYWRNEQHPDIVLFDDGVRNGETTVFSYTGHEIGSIRYVGH